MLSRTPIYRITAITAVTGAILVSAAVARADLTVKGDAAAWTEVAAAYKKLGSLPGYRMKVSSGGGASMMVIEVVPPDSFRSTMRTGSGQTGSGAMEMVSVKGQSRFRITTPGAPSGWLCQGIPPIQVPGDPTVSVQGTVEASRGPDTTVEGTPVRTYLYTTTFSAMGQSGTPKTTLYVGTQTGLPRRSVSSIGSTESTIDYYDYGAKIDITLPPCG